MVAQRVALVTGASRGIGAHVADLLAARGFRVLGTSRDEDGMMQVAARGHEAMRLDLGDAASVAQVARAALAAGPVEVLVNNAGYAELGPVEAVPRAVWDRQLAVNVVGPMDLAARLLPSMRQRRRGRIVMVSSVLGRVVAPLTGPYSASKHALEAATDALRAEVRPWGVHVTLVEPGSVDTSFTDAAVPGLVSRAGAAGEADAGERARRLVRRFRRGVAPEKVARVVVREATRASPRARRLVGWQARAAVYGRPLVPDALFDAVVAKVLRIGP